MTIFRTETIILKQVYINGDNCSLQNMLRKIAEIQKKKVSMNTYMILYLTIYQMRHSYRDKNSASTSIY